MALFDGWMDAETWEGSKVHESFTSYETPTGHICLMQGERGEPLEFLSLGDYGKQKNIKADFLGLTREINGVPHGELLPLEQKWVITISPQYGCSMGCKFCDVPKVGPGTNATMFDLLAQVFYAISLHPEVTRTDRLNLHFARMGEPTFNPTILSAVSILKERFVEKGWGFHPVISTMMPRKNKYLWAFLHQWLFMKNTILGGEAGLQLSINTTNIDARSETMPEAMYLPHIADMMRDLLKSTGAFVGRKIALNFALTDSDIIAPYLRYLFDPKYFMCKITPMHNTVSAVDNGLITLNGYKSYYPYQSVERDLKAAGFDVIVFIPSQEEDNSRITCGNAILALHPDCPDCGGCGYTVEPNPDDLDGEPIQMPCRTCVGYGKV